MGSIRLLRNRYRWISIVLTVVVVFLILILVVVGNRTVTLSNASKLHDGMALSDIKSIMGGDPGEYTSWWYSQKARAELHYEPIKNTIIGSIPGQRILEWRSEEVVLHVWVDENENEKVNLFDIWPRNPRFSYWSDFWSILTGNW